MFFFFFFEILSNLNQAVPNHLADESQTRQPDTPPDHPKKKKKKERLFGLAARNRFLYLSPLSFSSSSYFLSFSTQKLDVCVLIDRRFQK